MKDQVNPLSDSPTQGVILMPPDWRVSVGEDGVNVEGTANTLREYFKKIQDLLKMLLDSE